MTENLITLTYSDNGGGDWSNPISQEFAAKGEHDKVYQYQRLGIARDRVFEVSFVVDRPFAINGAWVDMEKLKS